MRITAVGSLLVGREREDVPADDFAGTVERKIFVPGRVREDDAKDVQSVMHTSFASTAAKPDSPHRFSN